MSSRFAASSSDFGGRSAGPGAGRARAAARDRARSAADHDHLDIAWRYARDHADALLADMKQYEGGRRFAEMVDGATDATTADGLEAFAREKLPEGALVEVRRGADEIRTRAALKARLAPQLAAALAAR
jgi:hypothetical protein